jgi:hypothetical protein
MLQISLEKLIVVQFINELLSSYEIRSLIIAFKGYAIGHTVTVECSPHLIYVKSVLVSSSRLHQGLQRGISIFTFSVKILYAFRTSPHAPLIFILH